MYQTLLLIGLLSTSLMASAMTDAELTKALRSDFNSCVMTLKTPRYVFHWADASDITPQGQFNQSFDPASPIFAQYIQKHGPAILRQRDSRDNDIAGPGVYLANDLPYTRSYGGQKNFGLIVGVLRPGAKVITQFCQTELTESQAEMNARGCNNVSRIDLLVSTSDPRCLKIKQLLFGANLDYVQGLLYPYGNSALAGCGSTRDPVTELTGSPGVDLKGPNYSSFSLGDTFVAYSPQLFSKVFGFTNRSLQSKDPQARELLSYLKTTQQKTILRTLGVNGSASAAATFTSPEVFNDTKIPTMSDVDLKKFNQKYTFGCVPVN